MFYHNGKVNNLWLAVCFIGICCESFTFADLTVTASPASIKRKRYKVSDSPANWLDALHMCKEDGYMTLIYSSSNLETFKTTRKALQAYRGYSNINIWTGFIKNYYDVGNEVEWIRELKCIDLDHTAYNIQGGNNTTQQCVYATLLDTSNTIISLHADDCQEQYQYVCFSFDNPPVQMKSYDAGKYYFNFTYNDMKATDESPETYEDCSFLCVRKRYCIAAIFSSNTSNCKFVWHYFEEQKNISLHEGTNTGIYIAVKHGDEVIFQTSSESTVVVNNSTELPCRTSTSSSVYDMYSSTEELMMHSSETSLSFNTGSTSLHIPDLYQPTASHTSSFGIHQAASDNASSTIPILSYATKMSTSTIPSNLYTMTTLKNVPDASFLYPSYTHISSSITLSSLEMKESFTMTSFLSTELFSSFLLEETMTMNSDVSSSMSVPHYETESSTTLFSVTSGNSSSNNVSQLCACQCLSIDDHQIDIIRLDKRQLSIFRRRFYSAVDDRMSSAVIGTTGAVVIVCVIFIIMLSDLLRFAQYLKNRSKLRKEP